MSQVAEVDTDLGGWMIRPGVNVSGVVRNNRHWHFQIAAYNAHGLCGNARGLDLERCASIASGLRADRGFVFFPEDQAVCRRLKKTRSAVRANVERARSVAERFAVARQRQGGQRELDGVRPFAAKVEGVRCAVAVALVRGNGR